MPQPAIQVEGLSKRYRLGGMRSIDQTLREAIHDKVEALWRKVRKPARDENDQTLWALRDVSFDVAEGEVVGIVGRNGAGKSTLLKLLSRITDPTQGQATIFGRVGSLLEVGTGFHPELTGRENIYLNGTILGMTRAEVRDKFDAIVDFAEIERFLDTPVKRYSSGMFVRLAFAVAAHLEPEVLLVDEVLAVGDASFQSKCLGKMGDVARDGRTILFVSHNMAAIRQMCPRSVWIDDGRLCMDGPSEQVVDAYLNHTMRRGEAGHGAVFETDPSKPFQVKQVEVVDEHGRPAPTLNCDQPVTVSIHATVRRPVHGLYGYLQVFRNDGHCVLESDSFDAGANPLDALPVGEHRLDVTFPPRVLGHGGYQVYLNFGSSMNDGGFDVDTPGVCCQFQLSDTRTARGDGRRGVLSTILPWRVAQATQAKAA